MTERQAYWIGLGSFLVIWFGFNILLETETFKTMMYLLGCWQFGSMWHWIWTEISAKYIKKNDVEA